MCGRRKNCDGYRQQTEVNGDLNLLTNLSRGDLTRLRGSFSVGRAVSRESDSHVQKKIAKQAGRPQESPR